MAHHYVHRPDIQAELFALQMAAQQQLLTIAIWRPRPPPPCGQRRPRPRRSQGPDPGMPAPDRISLTRREMEQFACLEELREQQRAAKSAAEASAATPANDCSREHRSAWWLLAAV